MERITLQFCSFDSTMGALIEWFTQGLVGHVDVVMPDGQLLGAQHEAGLGGKPSGVQIRPGNYGDTSGMRHRLRATFAVTDDQAAAFYAFLQEQVGKPYDVTAIEAFAAGRDWRNTDAWFCSELATAALEVAGVIRTLIAPANKVTPEGLMLTCSALVPITPA